MKHRGYNKTWYDGPVERLKGPMEKMILKAYPEYQTGDWVLWIVPDIFCEYYVEEVTGSIKIFNVLNQEMNVKYVTRRPYPNKGIYQISMSSGRKRLYGIPLVFKTFEELCEIRNIQIRWDIYHIMYLRDEPFDLRLTNCIVDYELDYTDVKKETDFRFFTVYSKEFMEADKDKFEKGEFDNAIWCEGSISFENKEQESELYDVVDLLHSPRKLSEEERKFLTCMEEEQKQEDLFEIYMPDSQKAFKEIEVLWEVYWYRKKEQLRAAKMADILPEPAFGFDRS